MNEISVNVKQEPGKITWNFEEIKTNLEAALAEYTGMVYDDDSIKSAKTDVATLRALAKTIEDRRKEVKEKCLEPYGVIEKQAKELVALMIKPIAAINTQVQDYEKRRKEKARAEIDAYWKQKVVVLRNVSGKKPTSISMTADGKMRQPPKRAGKRELTTVFS